MTGPREDGFTLVELLVSLVIFAVLSAAGVSLLQMSARSQAAVGERLEEVAAWRRISSLIASDLSAAVPRTTREVAGTLRPAFVGNAVNDGPLLVGFVRSGWSNLDQAARASLQKVDYRFEQGRLERVAYPALDGAEPEVPAVLADNIERFSIRYRARDGWRSQWEALGAEPMPSAIEITIGQAGRADVRQLFLVGAGR